MLDVDFTAFMSPSFCLIHFFLITLARLCVSASQDGKLIVWDSITTNKVGGEKSSAFRLQLW